MTVDAAVKNAIAMIGAARLNGDPDIQKVAESVLWLADLLDTTKLMLVAALSREEDLRAELNKRGAA